MNMSDKSTKLRRFLEKIPGSEKILTFLWSESGKRIILAFLGILFILLVFFMMADENSENQALKAQVSGTALTAEGEYELLLESRLEELISSVDGAGECKVMVTLSKGEYKIFAKDSYEDERENKYEYVIIDEGSGEDAGLVVNVVSPEIKGVAVVCEGGDSSVVHSEIVDMLSSVLSLKSTQISVSKMK